MNKFSILGLLLDPNTDVNNYIWECPRCRMMLNLEDQISSQNCWDHVEKAHKRLFNGTVFRDVDED